MKSTSMPIMAAVAAALPLLFPTVDAWNSASNWKVHSPLQITLSTSVLSNHEPPPHHQSKSVFTRESIQSNGESLFETWGDVDNGGGLSDTGIAVYSNEGAVALLKSDKTVTHVTKMNSIQHH